MLVAAEAARAAAPDMCFTFGGGTAIDTVKVMLIALAHDVTFRGTVGLPPARQSRTAAATYL